MKNDNGGGPPYDRCALCRKSEAGDTRTDHLRTVYVGHATLERGYFRPRLWEEEWFILQGKGTGEHQVCSNRGRCRARRRKQVEAVTP